MNDGSTDLTEKILETYSQKDSRIKIINQKNQGLSGARNTGLNAAKADYLTFIDSDDWVDSDYIEKLYFSAKRNDCDIAVSGMIRKRPKQQKYRLFFKEEKVYSSLQDKVDVCKIPACCYACGKLFKKSLITDKPFKSGVYFEDVLWIPYILKDASKIVTVPKTFYYYRANNTSIVKTVQSLQKQHDSYRAKSNVVKFFEENSLLLPEKNKHVTKRITYLFKIPVLKVKEYKDTETTFLFGFLQIKKEKRTPFYKIKRPKKFFLFKILDSHIYLNICGIHLGIKYNKKFEYEPVSEYGLNKEARKTPVTVSLTSFPARINTVHKTINTLLNQSVKPDRLILYLAEEQFPEKENELPEELLRLRDFGLEIRWCEDLKSYKKLVPALREFPEDIIVTADDDLYYQKDWLESLYNSYLDNPNFIYTRRACRIEKRGSCFVITPNYDNNFYHPDYSHQLMGGAGTLYPPRSLHTDVFDTKKMLDLTPSCDDIYFWAMSVINGTKISIVKNKDLNLYNVENSQSEALCKINKSVLLSKGKEPFNAILEEYPQIISLLDGKRAKNG